MKIRREVITEKLEAIEKWQHYLIFHHMLRVGNPIPCSSTTNQAVYNKHNAKFTRPCICEKCGKLHKHRSFYKNSKILLLLNLQFF